MTKPSSKAIAYAAYAVAMLMLGVTQSGFAKDTHPYFPKSPWQSHSRINASNTSPIYKQVWQQSKSRQCPILALPSNSVAHINTAKSRSAYFADGWGVAYDVTRYKNGKPLRSAYGVANAGTTKLSQIYAWPNQRLYADGSFVTFGREGNNPTGKFLAYLVLNNGCFYNVWSQVSQPHLQSMLSQLRYVK